MMRYMHLCRPHGHLYCESLRLAEQQFWRNRNVAGLNTGRLFVFTQNNRYKCTLEILQELIMAGNSHNRMRKVTSRIPYSRNGGFLFWIH